MRYLLFFMFLVGIFVLGRKNFTIGGFGPGISAKGPVKTEARTVSNFKGLTLEVPAKVDVRVGETFSVDIDAAENLLPILKTELDGNNLRIYFSENTGNVGEIRIRITAPAFEDFGIGGSGTIQVNTPLQANNMKLSIAGSGDIIMEQSTLGEVKSSIAGSGNITLGGTANKLETDISGSGDINAKTLAVNDLDVEIAGSGSVHAHVNNSISASIAGSGDVYYSGSPSKVDSDISGSGKVKKVE